MQKTILVVDDDPDVLAGTTALLAHSGWRVCSATGGREALREFEAQSPDVVLLDVMLPDISGIDVLDHIKGYSEATPVIVMSGVGTIDMAVEAMRKGAETFVSKPCDFDNLELVLEQVSRNVATRRELEALKRTKGDPERSFLGISAVAKEIESTIEAIAGAPSPVLLEGESGTGKGIVASLIHNRSDRARAPFVDLNCAGLSRELLESELFGHERGAFTDASSAKPGLFEIAANGTVFLDEVGELDPSVQARLLKAIEDRRFRRLGGIRDIRSEFRLIAATNSDLSEAVSTGAFRRDLFFRLSVIRLHIPPLRERLEDIPILSNALLERLGKNLGVSRPRISARAVERLSRYSWPGNVRELRNVLERALLTARSGEIRVEHLLLENQAMALGEPTLAPKVDWEIRPLDEVVADYIRQAVEAAGGNMRAAARLLDISPSTLYSKLKSEPKSAGTVGRK
ncbi:MAG: sigma-54 dependent transcriptional regulator [Thermoanaerobaculia bacterium]